MKIARYFLPLLIVITAAAGIQAPRVSALSGSEFKAGRIMDDSVFFNGKAMNPTQIQNFLNAKVPTCDTNHTKSTSKNDSGPPYTCLKDYRDNIKAEAAQSGLCNALTAQSNQTAAQIIYQVGKACGVSQKVILVTLQKEQGLVTDTWPWQIQYDRAMGYGCPDSTGCNSNYYGFFNQVYKAAWQFKRYAKFPDTYNYQGGVTSYIQWNPKVSCGGSNVGLSNQATAGLYNYTPYRPNKAALDNLYGSGNSCSAYGNRNFWRYYRDWFGLTTAASPYAWSFVSSSVYADSARTQKYTTGITSVAPGNTLYITLKLKNTGGYIWGQPDSRIGTSNPHDRNSDFSDGTWLTPNRPAALTETSVYPGETGTFNFTLHAPSTTGYYIESFGFAEESFGWASGNITYHIQVVDPAPLQSANYNLPSSSSIKVGEELMSRDKRAVLILQKDGNLVLYKDFVAVWSTKTSGKKSKSLVMQSDGNLVLYDSSNRPLWASGTNGNPGATFSLQIDGNGVIYNSGSPLWATNTYRFPDGLKYVVNIARGDYTILNGQGLINPARTYQFWFQSDGNLVLYDGSTAIWSSHTYGHPDSFLKMQTDGNLVIYDRNKGPIWSTHTNGNAGASLVLQGDRNVVIYSAAGKPLWSTKTSL